MMLSNPSSCDSLSKMELMWKDLPLSVQRLFLEGLESKLAEMSPKMIYKVLYR